MSSRRNGHPALRLAATFLVLLLAAAPVALGQDEPGPGRPEEGFLFRADGDVAVPPGETIGAVVVAGGSARVEGETGALVVINGTATLAAGGVVGDLVVIDGVADLQDGALVRGDVTLVDSTLQRAPGAQVQGTVSTGESLTESLAAFAALFGLVVFLGVPLALVLAGLAAAAFAPRQFRAAGAALTRNATGTLVGALVVWILLPILAVVAFVSLVGIPLALGILLVLLPLLWFLGALVVGIRLGDALAYRRRPEGPPTHPYLAALVGILILVVVSWIPVLGPLVFALAGLAGAGAVAAVAWRTAMTGRRAERRVQRAVPP